jgi:hypothetical protein
MNQAAADICGNVANDQIDTIGDYGSDGANEEILSNNNTANAQITSKNITKLQSDYISDNRALWHTTVINNEYAAIGGLINAAAGIAGMANSASVGASSGAMQGAAGGPVAAGASGVASATTSLINSGINVAASGASTVIGIANSMDITSVASQLNTEKTQHAIDNMRDVNEIVRDLNRDNTEESNRSMRYATKKQNKANKETTKDIVDTNNANAERTQSTNNANAVRTQGTNNANAGRTQNTETNNADYLRDVIILNNKANLVQAQKDAKTAYKNERLRRPVKQTETSGDAYPDVWQRRGVRLNIRTQTESAIRQTGDAFLRFGYALHRIWDMTQGFNYMRYFTFWKAEDVWVNDGTGVANIATNTIADILLKGVTVWSDPTKIGLVSIYDNMRGGA